ncbi:DUF4410 domain-containing protein [Puniceicoccaceae bacterium K14]|nr:DUF4410 domain-containing protein [Puniceicoccaceae bacterium K14]
MIRISACSTWILFAVLLSVEGKVSLGSGNVINLAEAAVDEQELESVLENMLNTVFLEQNSFSLPFDTIGSSWAIKGEILRREKGSRALQMKVGYGVGSARLKVRIQLIEHPSGEIVDSFVIDERTRFRGPMSERTSSLNQLSKIGSRKVIDRIVKQVEY